MTSFSIPPIRPEGRSAILFMDYQNDILNICREKQHELFPTFLSSSQRLYDAVRSTNLSQSASSLTSAPLVIHVAFACRPGHPEINRATSYSFIAEANINVAGTVGADFDDAMRPDPHHFVIQRPRASAFYGSELDTLLRVWGVTRVYLTGIAISGCVVSTFTSARDMDYNVSVIRECVWDPDENISPTFVEVYFARAEEVVGVDEVIRRLANKE